MTAHAARLSSFAQSEFTFAGFTRTVYRKGEGPGIVVMHEVPGLHPGVIAFADTLVNHGYTVFMPTLLGTPGKPFGFPYNIESLAKACVRKEFTLWATKRNSPITEWLRGLARFASEACGGPVGAVGMCLTGGFALAMMVDEYLAAPVLSQPSLPIGILPRHKRDLGIDSPTLTKVKQRAADDGVCVLGLRFTGDRLVPKERFQRLREELGDNFIAVEIDSSRGNPHGIGPLAHSVLTRDFVDEPGHPTHDAYLQVLEFFSSRLQPA